MSGGTIRNNQQGVSHDAAYCFFQRNRRAADKLRCLVAVPAGVNTVGPRDWRERDQEKSSRNYHCFKANWEGLCGMAATGGLRASPPTMRAVWAQRVLRQLSNP